MAEMLRRPQPSRPARPLLMRGYAAALGLALVLSSCTAKGGSPGPTTDPGTAEQAAAALAAGLARRDVSAVPFSGASGAEVNAQLTPLVAGMGTVKPSVAVGAVDTQGDKATATLRFGWSFPGVAPPWTYDSTAQLVQDGGQWKTSWQPGILAPGLDGTNRLSERRDAAPRGEILGADGDAIVTARPVVRIGIDKTKVSGQKAT
jgi:hypothetical protein